MTITPCPTHGFDYMQTEPCRYCAANKTAARDSTAKPADLPWCGDPHDMGCVPQHRWVSWTDSRGYLLTRRCECHP